MNEWTLALSAAAFVLALLSLILLLRLIKRQPDYERLLRESWSANLPALTTELTGELRAPRGVTRTGAAATTTLPPPPPGAGADTRRAAGRPPPRAVRPPGEPAPALNPRRCDTHRPRAAAKKPPRGAGERGRARSRRPLPRRPRRRRPAPRKTTARPKRRARGAERKPRARPPPPSPRTPAGGLHRCRRDENAGPRRGRSDKGALPTPAAAPRPPAAPPRRPSPRIRANTSTPTRPHPPRAPPQYAPRRPGSLPAGPPTPPAPAPPALAPTPTTPPTPPPPPPPRPRTPRAAARGGPREKHRPPDTPARPVPALPRGRPRGPPPRLVGVPPASCPQAGPPTPAPLLSTPQMGFPPLALQRRSSEMWGVLGAVATAFATSEGALAAAQRRAPPTRAGLAGAVRAPPGPPAARPSAPPPPPGCRRPGRRPPRPPTAPHSTVEIPTPHPPPPPPPLPSPLFLLFIAYSTLGWCGEMIYCSVPRGACAKSAASSTAFSAPSTVTARCSCSTPCAAASATRF